MNRRTGTIFVLPLVGVALFAILSFDVQWRGEWNWTVDTITGSTVLTGPLVGSAAAYIAASQRKLDPLIASSVRGWQVPILAGWRAWLLGLGAYIVTALVALIVTLVTTHGGPLTWWALLIGPAVLAFCAMTGAALGWWWPHRLAPVVAAPGLFLVGTFGPAPIGKILRHGPVTGSLAGLDYDPVVWSLQLLALVAGAALCCSALLPWRSRSTWVAGGLVTAVALAAFLGAWGGLVSTGIDRFERSTETASACAGPPRVCLAPSHNRFLDGTARGIAKATAPLDAIGVDLPERYEELLPGYKPPVSSGMLTNVTATSAKDIRRQAFWAATPAACPAWTDPAKPPPDPAFEAQDLIVEWIVARLGEQAAPWSDESRDWLAQPDAPDRVAWITRTYGQLKDCQLGEIVLPWSSPS